MRLNRLGYLIGAGFRSIFSHGLMSFATVTIIMACLIIMGSFSLLVVNINSMITDLEQENEVVAYVDDNLPVEDARALEGEIEALPNVSSADFVTRDQAEESFKSQYPDSNFDEIDPTVFRHRFTIHLTDISLMAETKLALDNVDGVAKVSAHQEYADGFVTVRNIVGVISLVLIVILMIVSLFIMTNTIKLATFTRREEIGIMKMVGASNAFIRCPFVVEGLTLGLIGGGLAFLLQWGIYSLVTGKLVTGVTGALITVVPFTTLMLPVLIVFLGVGVLVGAVGGSAAIRNYLKV